VEALGRLGRAKDGQLCSAIPPLHSGVAVIDAISRSGAGRESVANQVLGVTRESMLQEMTKANKILP
jgi:hypothetical protein